MKDRKNENKEYGQQYDKVKDMDKRQANNKTLTKHSDTSTKKDENKKLEKDEKPAWKLSDSISNPRSMKVAIGELHKGLSKIKF